VFAYVSFHASNKSKHTDNSNMVEYFLFAENQAFYFVGFANKASINPVMSACVELGYLFFQSTH
jgi:phage terminase large subunit-like protein